MTLLIRSSMASGVSIDREDDHNELGNELLNHFLGQRNQSKTP